MKDRYLIGVDGQGKEMCSRYEIPLPNYWMAVINKIDNNKCQRECGGIGTFIRCSWECKCVAPLENSLAVL